MPVYDAFISYSHAQDKPIAAALQRDVQRLGKPWYRRRALRIFRDDTSLSATPQLWPSIENALAQSRFLILLASPEAAHSHWVDKEVGYWLQHKSPETLLIGVTHGVLAWDEQAGDFTNHDGSPLPPVLKGGFRAEPKWIDLTPYRAGVAPGGAKFMELGADFAAAIHGMPKEDLLSQELQQQRRALMLAWGAAGFLLFLAGIAAWQWNDAVTQRKFAETQRDRAERTLTAATRTADTLIFDLAQEFRKRTGMPVDLTRTVLERVQDLQRQLAQAGERTPELLQLEAVTLDELFTTFSTMGDNTAALSAAERARAILQDLVSRFPTDVRLRRDLAVAINNIGDVRYAISEKWDETAGIYREALAIIERLVALRPDDTKLQNDLSICLNKVGSMLAFGGRHRDALQIFQRSLAIGQKLATAAEDNAQWLGNLAFIHGRIGLMQAALGETASALDSYQASASLNEKLVAIDGNNTEWQRNLAYSVTRSGLALLATGKRDEALPLLERGRSIVERLVATDGANSLWQRDLAIAEDQIGEFWQTGKNPVRSIEAYRRSLAIREKLAASHPAHLPWQRELAGAYDRLGKILASEGDNEASLALFRKMLPVRKFIAAADPVNASWQRDWALAHYQIATALAALGQTEDALDEYLASLSVIENYAAANPTLTQSQIDLVAGLFQLALVGNEPRERLDRALAIIRKLDAEGRLNTEQKGWIDYIEEGLRAFPK